MKEKLKKKLKERRKTIVAAITISLFFTIVIVFLMGMVLSAIKFVAEFLFSEYTLGDTMLIIIALVVFTFISWVIYYFITNSDDEN